jgi:hypothetical protein
MLFGSCPGLFAIEKAGTLFVEVDAASLAPGRLNPGATWMNNGPYSNFTAVGNPLVGKIATAPAVIFDGNDDAFVGADPAPEGLTGIDPTRSIEAWVFNPAIASEETVVAWGHRGTPDGGNMAFNYGNHGNFGAVGHWGGCCHDVGWIDNDFTPGAPEAGQWHLLAYTYDGETTRVYSDGTLWNEEDTLELWGGLNTYPEPPIAIASQWNDVDPTVLNGGLKGSLGIGRLRIHDGVLTEAQILANYNEEKGAFPKVEPPQPPTPAPIPRGPIHRYSFNEPSQADAGGATINDSVGNAHGIVKGEGSQLTGSGLQLDGGDQNTAAYVDLPNGLISKLTDVTIESWLTIEGTDSWARVFDFGNNNPGGDDGELTDPGDDNGGNTQGMDYLMLSAARGTNTVQHRLEMRNVDDGNAITTIDFDDDPEGVNHYVVVYDSDGDPLTGQPVLSAYAEGRLVGSSTTAITLEDINDVNNWLGRSNWTNDANLAGTYDEFRIYDYALTDDQVLGNFNAGPSKINTPGDLDGDGDCDATDIDLLGAAIRSGSTEAKFDINGDGRVDGADHATYIADVKHTWLGDSNLDGEFSSSDFVFVFTVGEYEDAIVGNSGWGDGDWNFDGDFNSSDFVAAFTQGGYEKGPLPGAVAGVPEPTSVVLMGTAVGCLLIARRGRRRKG